ncbi:uncharacterized protein LOC125449150 isoform X2 [Stegostoma tigrinum]|uniref:uncharacterized protein LOC125449150 isoform X2 n=1 Tax=Stegostoma tigrinum TaxID=3053191 RepID=UPI00287089E9|nr:uncharacterized protein LOC125449150 isoform X2 [Stegostoma tigrinum]
MWTVQEKTSVTVASPESSKIALLSLTTLNCCSPCGEATPRLLFSKDLQDLHPVVIRGTFISTNSKQTSHQDLSDSIHQVLKTIDIQRF